MLLDMRQSWDEPRPRRASPEDATAVAADSVSLGAAPCNDSGMTEALRLRRWPGLVVLVLGVAWLVVVVGGVAWARPRPTHDVRLLAALAEVPAVASTPSPVPGGSDVRVSDVSATVASCDLGTLDALANEGVVLPTTPVSRLGATTCAVVPIRDVANQRLLVAPLDGDPSLGAPPGLSGADVKDARAEQPRFPSGVGHAVDVFFTAAGAAKFNAMASALYKLQNTEVRGDVAIVIDGQVLSSPAFEMPAFSGPLQLTANLTTRQASQLAAIIRQARTR